MIDKSILKELKEALEKCTPGEWRIREYAGGHIGVDVNNPTDWRTQVFSPTVSYDGYGSGGSRRSDANFIVLAKNHMLSLLNSYEELEKERDELASFKVNMLHAAKLDHELYESRKQTVRTLADALRMVVKNWDALPDDSDTWTHSDMVETLADDAAACRAALSDPIVKQIVGEK